MSQRSRQLAPGDKLGRYDLIRQIAIGGMAELYLARTVGIEGFEKLVVVKRILPQHAANASFVEMFLNEARIAATLQHPNVAQVYDIGVDDGDYFFAMEYVHGEDLDAMVAQSNEQGVPIALDAALTLVCHLLAGLHYAHEKLGPDGKPLEIVHRDVSPSNVLVSYDGAVKLVDFGIARATRNRTTTRGGLKGKIAYMSPEQCRASGQLDRRSDLFSVGMILYELTTGQLPFTGETEYQLLDQIVNRDAPPPSSFVPDYPPALERIVLTALARERTYRYATALELQGHLEDFAHETRLRVSPLVLARLMSNLYPARLEEWAHAKAQGGFFVEQHVVRTLIEDGKTPDPNDPALRAAQEAIREDAEAEATAVDPLAMDTSVDQPPFLDAPRTPPRTPTPPGITGAMPRAQTPPGAMPRAQTPAGASRTVTDRAQTDRALGPPTMTPPRAMAPPGALTPPHAMTPPHAVAGAPRAQSDPRAPSPLPPPPTAPHAIAAPPTRNTPAKLDAAGRNTHAIAAPPTRNTPAKLDAPGRNTPPNHAQPARTTPAKAAAPEAPMRTTPAKAAAPEGPVRTTPAKAPAPEAPVRNTPRSMAPTEPPPTRKTPRTLTASAARARNTPPSLAAHGAPIARATPVPGVPGAVPIIPMNAGVLVTSSTSNQPGIPQTPSRASLGSAVVLPLPAPHLPQHAEPAPVAATPVPLAVSHAQADVTERVRVHRRASSDTNFVRTPRKRSRLLWVAGLLVIGGGLAAVIALRGSGSPAAETANGATPAAASGEAPGDERSSTEPPAPAAVDPAKPAEPSAPAAVEPAKPAEPSAPAAVEPAKPAEPSAPAAVEPAKPAESSAPAAVEQGKPAEPPAAAIAEPPAAEVKPPADEPKPKPEPKRPRPVAKPAAKSVRKPAAHPAVSPTPPKEPKSWNTDSPFMPVRTH